MLTISDILNDDFEWDEVKIDDDEFEKLSTELIIDFLKKNTPKERQLLAISWNFDNSKKVIQWIVDQPDTDRGTILYLYWYMAPDFYNDQIYAFNPTNDLYSGGYNWTKGYDDSKAKSKIPEVMFKALDGEILESPDWDEGIPEALSVIMDKLCNALDE